MAVYLVEIPLKVRAFGFEFGDDIPEQERERSIKFVVDAEDSQEACNKVAVLIAESLKDGLEEDEAPVLLS